VVIFGINPRARREASNTGASAARGGCLNLISIGRFSRLTGLSIRALRLYDAEHLLEPARVDPDTGYRYYDFEQVQIAERIKLLRECEMPLDDILGTLRDSKNATKRLLMHRQRLEQRLQQHHCMLQTMDALLRQEHQSKNFEASYRFSTAQPMLCISEHVIWQEHSTDTPLGQGFQIIQDLVHRHSIPVAGAPLRTYQIPWRKRSVQISTCVPILGRHQGEGHIENGELEAAELAYTIHEGDYPTLPKTLEMLLAWVKQQGHTVNGLVREIYLEHPQTVRDPKQYRTEIAVPIKRGVSLNREQLH
jgi:DNA-binding transcriptional MerR regulator